MPGRRPGVTLRVAPDPGVAPAPAPPIEIRHGPSSAAELEARALAICTHTKRKGFGSEVLACLTCSLVVLHGREAVMSGRALPVSGDPMCRMVQEIMADGGERSLNAPGDSGSLLAEVNRRRLAAGQSPYTETGLSARIRDLRQLGYDYQRRKRSGVAVYRYVPPDPEPAGV